MRFLLYACLVLAGCSGGERPAIDAGDDRPTAAELAEQAELLQVSDIAERGQKEVDRLIAEGKAAGIENEVRAAVGRLNEASNARLVVEGQLSAAKWYEQQVTGKTPAQFIAAFPEK
jgi:hypothetical protein